jgi:hypothetical protein
MCGSCFDILRQTHLALSWLKHVTFMGNEGSTAKCFSCAVECGHTVMYCTVPHIIQTLISAQGRLADSESISNRISLRLIQIEVSCPRKCIYVYNCCISTAGAVQNVLVHTPWECGWVSFLTFSC